jgi:hypothetical protein
MKLALNYLRCTIPYFETNDVEISCKNVSKYSGQQENMHEGQQDWQVLGVY